LRILVTGASGFIGKSLCRRLQDTEILRVMRASDNRSNCIVIDDIAADVDWSRYFIGVDVIIHLAALAHDSLLDASEDYIKKVNEFATLNMANYAKRAGVKRFIFLSSIGVNGCKSDVPFKFSDVPAPHDFYSQTKLDAEARLEEMLLGSGTDFVIIRPPLVYGPGVKANFHSMLRWVARAIPLPLGGIKNNKRSLVYVENLVDLVRVCIEHPAAANQIFLVSDGEDVSTRDLLLRAAQSLGVKSRLLNVPPKLLGIAGRFLGKKGIEQRLCGSLQVDIEHTKQILDWAPPYSIEEGLLRTADWYKQGSI